VWLSSADGTRGRCPLDSRAFFEKKLSKSFISPAGGMGFQICFYAVVAVLPKAGQDGRDHAPQGAYIFHKQKEIVMALRTILVQDDPMLRKKCRPVTVFNDRIKQLVDDLVETLKASGGVGLAAPQIGILRRVAVIMDINKKPEEVIVLINPEVIDKKGSERVPEVCLSFPNVWGYVTRPTWAKIRAQDVNGNWFEREGEDVVAQCFCHETEHLDGHVFTDRIEEFIDPEDIKQA